MAEYLITAPDGKKYKVTGATKEGALAALKAQLGSAAPAAREPTGSELLTAQSEAAIEQAKNAGSYPKTDSFIQGGLGGYGDEIIGGFEAARSGFKPGAYTEGRDKARKWLDAASAEAPKSHIAGAATTGIPLAVATGGQSLWQMILSGAGIGAAQGYGHAEGNDFQALKDAGEGAAWGAGGALVGYGAGTLISKFIPKGLAAATIQKALAGKPGELLLRIRQLGGSAAEADQVLQEVLRTQSAKNSNVAMQMLPGARDRLADVNKQAVDEINKLISPENVAAFGQRTQDATRQAVKPAYDAVKANPAQVGLTPEMSALPGVDEAIEAARQFAKFKKRPFDPEALTAQDLDVMQRFLRLKKEKAFTGDALETLKGEDYGIARNEVNELAKSVSPELAQAQSRVALQKSIEEATELGKQALNPSKEAIEVAEEFSKLGAEAQEGYRAAFATRLRAMLAMRGTGSNAAGILDKPAVIEKMKALGFPPAEIDAIIARGTAARGTVDALQGGSDTARKIAAAKASESPLTKMQATDVVAAGITHPATLGILPMLRGLGQQQEMKAAALVIKALADQNPKLLEALLRFNLRPTLGTLGATVTNQIGQSR